MRNSTKTTNTRVFCVLVAVLFAAPATFAQGKKKEAAPSAPARKPAAQKPAASSGTSAPATGASDKLDTDRLDISDLEQKYWSPKDTDFGVVQNRTYTKEKRFSVSLLTGPSMNDFYSEGFALGVSANYFFTERHGVELFYVAPALSESSQVKEFKRLPGGQVGIPAGRDTGYYGVGYNFVPIYAKMSLLGRKIVYFDMAITPGIGFANYEQQRENASGVSQGAFAYSLDVTQYFFFSRRFALRFDFRNRWFTEKRINPAQLSNYTAIGSKTTNLQYFFFGASFFF